MILGPTLAIFDVSLFGVTRSFDWCSVCCVKSLFRLRFRTTQKFVQIAVKQRETQIEFITLALIFQTFVSSNCAIQTRYFLDIFC